MSKIPIKVLKGEEAEEFNLAQNIGAEWIDGNLVDGITRGEVL